MITVIMPVYNVEEILLRKSIESVLYQEESAFELILVDDGSNDGKSGEICDEYAAIDQRIKVYHTENKGVSAARNLGLEKAKGEYIFFVDSDDYLDQSCLAKLLKAITEASADAAMCASIHVSEGDMVYAGRNTYSNEKLLMNQEEAVEALCYMKQPYADYEFGAVWGCLYKKESLLSARFNENMRIGEDFEFKFRVFQNIKNLICLEDKLYYYLIRTKSAMRSGFDLGKIKSVEELEKFIKSHNIRKEYIQDYKSRAVNIAIVILFMIPVEKEFSEYRNYIQSFIKANRYEVLRNKKTRKKVKLALITSYLGFNFSQKLFSASR